MGKQDVMSVMSYQSNLHANRGSSAPRYNDAAHMYGQGPFQPGQGHGLVQQQQQQKQKREFRVRDRVRFNGCEWDVIAVNKDSLSLQNDQEQKYLSKAQYKQLQLV